jgi:hypothetical protein
MVSYPGGFVGLTSLHIVPVALFRQMTFILRSRVISTETGAAPRGAAGIALDEATRSG